MITEVRFENWMRYKGKQSFKLGAGVYAVTAELDSDSRRSNWLGKSSLLWGMGPFILYGKKPKAVTTEDGWITNGQGSGFFSITIDDEITITRARKRGASTKLTVKTSQATYNGDEAERFISKMLRLSRDDLFNTCFFEQKKMSRFILATPGTRMEIVNEWLNLSPLQECEKECRSRVSKVVTETKADLSRIAAIKARLEELQNFKKTDEITARKEVKKSEERLEEAIKGEALLKTTRRDHVDSEKYLEITKRGKLLVATHKGVDIDSLKKRLTAAEEDHAQKRSTLTLAIQEVKAARNVDREFDGNCPALRGFECPAVDEINTSCVAKADALYKAQVACGVCREECTDAELKADDIADKVAAHDKRASNIKSMRETVAALKPAHDRASKTKEVTISYPNLESSRAEKREVEEVLRQIQRTIDTRNQLLEEQQELESQLGENQLVVFREGVQVFKAAQRRLAEHALARIERGANALLGEACIPLTVKVQWGREGKGWASVCDVCGTPFPRSVKIKECEGCEADRGKKVVERLDVVLSDVSGAADDLGGIAIQLSAAAWLRAKRDSPWDTAFIDEPFGSLDASNCEALAAHFVTMLRRPELGFRQAFVIAHQRTVMDALPERLDITATSSASVVNQP